MHHEQCLRSVTVIMTLLCVILKITPPLTCMHLFKVLAQPTIAQQEEEMRRWFKAFRDQDYSKRDYRKYFKVCIQRRLVMRGQLMDSRLSYGPS